MVTIKIKNIEGITLPKNGSDNAAGYDIIATSDPKIVGEKIYSNSWKYIDYIEYETNLYIAPIIRDIHTLIFPRSSISKYNLILANSVGLCDNDYRGQILCRFKYQWQPSDFEIISESGNYLNVGNINEEKIYKKGDKIAQLVFSSTINVNFELINELPTTARGSGGFGSTGVSSVKSQDHQLSNTTLIDQYIKSGGVPSKQKYSDEIKERQQL